MTALQRPGWFDNRPRWAMGLPRHTRLRAGLAVILLLALLGFLPSQVGVNTHPTFLIVCLIGAIFLILSFAEDIISGLVGAVAAVVVGVSIMAGSNVRPWATDPTPAGAVPRYQYVPSPSISLDNVRRARATYTLAPVVGADWTRGAPIPAWVIASGGEAPLIWSRSGAFLRIVPSPGEERVARTAVARAGLPSAGVPILGYWVEDRAKAGYGLLLRTLLITAGGMWAWAASMRRRNPPDASPTVEDKVGEAPGGSSAPAP